jgi:phenol 2-monooxygenase
MFEVFGVHKSPRHEVNLLDLPAIVHPWDDELGWDYGKVYTDEKAYQNPTETGHLYEDYGVMEEGCAILLRPDHHVCIIANIKSVPELCKQYLKKWFFVSGKRLGASPIM